MYCFSFVLIEGSFLFSADLSLVIWFFYSILFIGLMLWLITCALKCFVRSGSGLVLEGWGPHRKGFLGFPSEGGKAEQWSSAGETLSSS